MSRIDNQRQQSALEKINLKLNQALNEFHIKKSLTEVSVKERKNKAYRAELLEKHQKEQHEQEKKDKEERQREGKLTAKEKKEQYMAAKAKEKAESNFIKKND